MAVATGGKAKRAVCEVHASTEICKIKDVIHE